MHSMLILCSFESEAKHSSVCMFIKSLGMKFSSFRISIIKRGATLPNIFPTILFCSRPSHERCLPNSPIALAVCHSSTAAFASHACTWRSKWGSATFVMMAVPNMHHIPPIQHQLGALPNTHPSSLSVLHQQNSHLCFESSRFNIGWVLVWAQLQIFWEQSLPAIVSSDGSWSCPESADQSDARITGRQHLQSFHQMGPDPVPKVEIY